MRKSIHITITAGLLLLGGGLIGASLSTPPAGAAPDRIKERAEREAQYADQQAEFAQRKAQPANRPGGKQGRMRQVFEAVADKDLEVNPMAPLLMQNLPQIAGLLPPSVLYVYTEGLLDWSQMDAATQEEYRAFLTSAPYLDETEAAKVARVAQDYFAQSGVTLASLNSDSTLTLLPAQHSPDARTTEKKQGPPPIVVEVIAFLLDQGVTTLSSLTDEEIAALRDKFRETHRPPEGKDRERGDNSKGPDAGNNGPMREGHGRTDSKGPMESPEEIAARVMRVIGVLLANGITTTEQLMALTKEDIEALREELADALGPPRDELGGPGGARGREGKKDRPGPGADERGPGGGQMLRKLGEHLNAMGIVELAEVTEKDILAALETGRKEREARGPQDESNQQRGPGWFGGEGSRPHEGHGPPPGEGKPDHFSKLLEWLQAQGVDDLTALTDEEIQALQQQFHEEMKARREREGADRPAKAPRQVARTDQPLMLLPAQLAGEEREARAKELRAEIREQKGPRVKQRAFEFPKNPAAFDQVDPDGMVRALNTEIAALLTARPNTGPKQVLVVWNGETADGLALPPLMNELLAAGATAAPLSSNLSIVSATALPSRTQLADPFYHWDVTNTALPMPQGATAVDSATLWAQALAMPAAKQQQLLNAINQDAVNETMLDLAPEDYGLPALYPDPRASKLVYQMLTKERGVKDLGNNFVQITALRLMQRVAPTSLAVGFDPAGEQEPVRARVATLQHSASGGKPGAKKHKQKVDASAEGAIEDYRLDCSRFSANLFLEFQRNGLYESGSTFTLIDQTGGTVLTFTKP